MILPTPKMANPKPAKSSDGGRSCWYRFYAMYSEQFVEEVLAASGLGADSVVLDPWLGVGTTAAVAARCGMRAVGFDINPAMVVVANGRCIGRDAADAVVKAAERASRRMRFIPPAKDDPLLDWFGPFAASALRAWQRLAQTLFCQGGHPRKADFLLTAIFEAAWKLAECYRAKNPTWVKKPPARDRVDCPTREVTKSVLALIRKKAADCHSAEGTASTIRLGSSTSLDLPTSSIDFAITSPPYCTRIDYAVSTRIELALLEYDDQAVAELRDSTMGTSTIRRIGQASEKSWGPNCTELLTQIRLHPSKSSANYYYKTFVQYFADLYRSLGELNRCLKPSAGAVIVVQDSRYKGIRIDLAGILTEMATSFRWALARRVDYDVTQTMRRVNTRSRQYRADAASVESALWFTVPSGA